MKKLLLLLKKNFGVLWIEQCNELGLEFCHNLFGDAINNFNCRSIWRNKEGKSYRCESLVNEDIN